MHINTMKKHTAIYLCCKLEDVQRIHLIIESCKLRAKNPETVEIYSDFNFSKNTFDRPALQNLIADIKADKIQQVITFTPDHLTRSSSDYFLLREFFLHNRVEYSYVREETYDLERELPQEASSKKYLSYNRLNDQYGIFQDSGWINPGLHCNDFIEININGTWVPTRIDLTGDSWYLKGTGFRGDALKDIEVR